MTKKILSIIISVLMAGSLICGPATAAYGLDYTEFAEKITPVMDGMHLKVDYQVLLPRYSYCYAVFNFNGGSIVWTADSGVASIGSTHSLSGDAAGSYDIGCVYAEGSATLGPQTYKALDKSGNIYDRQWCTNLTYTSKQEVYTRRIYLYKLSFDIYGLDTRELTGVSYYCIESDGTGTCVRTQNLSEAVAQLVPEKPPAYEVTLKVKVPRDSYDASYGDTVLAYTVTDETSGKSYFVNVPITPDLPVEGDCFVAEKNIIISGEDYSAVRTRACRKYYESDCVKDGMTVTFTMAECNPGGLAHNVLSAGP